MLVCGAAAVCQLLTHDFQGADFATDENSLVISENMVHDTMTLMVAVYIELTAVSSCSLTYELEWFQHSSCMVYGEAANRKATNKE